MNILPLRASSGPIDCSLQDNYSRFNDTQGSETCHVCLSTSAVIGLTFHALMGLASLVALLGLVFWITRNYYRKSRGPNPDAWPLFKCNLDILMLNLIISDILMSFGATLDIRWASKRQVYCGSYCNTQGVIQTMGETAAALSTLSVAIYTFMALGFARPPGYRPWISSAIVIVIWLWVILWSMILLTKYDDPGMDEEGNVLRGYVPTPWWCWINGKYRAVRIVAEYVWLWIAGICTIALYVPGYFIARNKPGRPHQPGENGPQAAEDRSFASSNSSTEEGDIAAKLLWYPLAYTICVLPLSVIRWTSFAHPDLFKRPGFLPGSMFASCLFNIMGLINVVLTFYNRPAILLIGYKEPVTAQRESLNNLRRDSVFGGEQVGMAREVQ